MCYLEVVVVDSAVLTLVSDQELSQCVVCGRGLGQALHSHSLVVLALPFLWPVPCTLVLQNHTAFQLGNSLPPSLIHFPSADYVKKQVIFKCLLHYHSPTTVVPFLTNVFISQFSRKTQLLGQKEFGNVFAV